MENVRLIDSAVFACAPAVQLLLDRLNELPPLYAVVKYTTVEVSVTVRSDTGRNGHFSKAVTSLQKLALITHMLANHTNDSWEIRIQDCVLDPMYDRIFASK